MAAGRHSSYPNNEFRDLQYDFDPSRRDSTFSKDGNPRGYGKGNPEKGRIQAMKDTPSIRPKDIKERDVINGGYRSSSGKSDLKISFARHRFLVRSVDREPGELSSDSGSDVAMEPGPCAKDNDVLKTENETQFPMNPRKRKFSPIIWDSDEKEASKKCKTTVGRNSSNLLPPSMPKALRLSPNIISCSVEETSPKKYSKPNISQASLMNHSASSNSYANALPDSLVLSPSQHQLHLGNDKDADQLDDEYYVPTAWNITASRWADNAAASAEDEGDVSDKEEISNKRRRLFCSELLNSRANHRSLSPEPGELSVERPWTNPPDCAVRINRGRSSSSDDYPGSDFQNNDYRAVDDECDVGIPSTSHSKTDSEKGSDYHDTPEPARPLQRSLDMLHGCRSVDDFERLNKIDEGTYGVVYRAKDNKTGEIVALKKVKMEKEREGFPLTSLREINIILSFHHSSIVDVKEVVVGSSIDSIFMVMEYMEHDLKALMETMKQPFSQSEVKCLMIQLLEGVKYLHDNWVLHRDLKTSNLLLNNRGELKICDFGLSRQYGSPLKPYTHLVVTLWYRAPELLLGAKQYSTAIDMWSLGCIMAEILSRKPLFDGKTEVEQLDKIFRTLGTPNETIWSGFSKLPGVKFNFVKHQYNVLRKKFPATSFTGFPVLSDSGFELLNKFLTYDPDKRITAEEALNHEWFHEVPLPKSKDFMPTFPSQHVRDRRLRQVMKSPDPLEEQRRKELQHGELGMSGLFG